MDEQPDQKSPEPHAEEEKLMARRVTLLECLSGRAITGKKARMILVTLGHVDASVDQIALDVPDAKKLLYRLAVALGHENLPLGPATEPKILRRWVVPHSVGRAELNVEGEEDEYLEQLKHDLPELAARGGTPASGCAAASGRDRGVETKQYWRKYERVSTTKGPARGRKQPPREFRHGLLGEYLGTQFNSLRRVLRRVGKGAAKPETLMKKVKRLVLIALDAGRSGT